MSTVTDNLVVKLSKTFTAKGATEPTTKSREVGFITMFDDGTGLLTLNHGSERFNLFNPRVAEGAQPRPLPASVEFRKVVKLRKEWSDRASGKTFFKYYPVGVFTMFTSGNGVLDMNFTSDSYAVFPLKKRDEQVAREAATAVAPELAAEAQPEPAPAAEEAPVAAKRRASKPRRKAKKPALAAVPDDAPDLSAAV